jgi:hypothetical protein
VTTAGVTIGGATAEVDLAAPMCVPHPNTCAELGRQVLTLLDRGDIGTGHEIASTMTRIVRDGIDPATADARETEG